MFTFPDSVLSTFCTVKRWDLINYQRDKLPPDAEPFGLLLGWFLFFFHLSFIKIILQQKHIESLPAN